MVSIKYITQKFRNYENPEGDQWMHVNEKIDYIM